ncbi:hypothetical protein M378DRAFT_160725 [Amanita muscaria Koide BX008]|uniref:Uncharacterized protein n=1 Tax=Amanita muscaria (strain Koide BX008) TaxID=946122 RepID=A0A0C2XCY4_AMAMK|nr:hypothetical protein M378DRAFT_160725 [Amanita muscaria Koide BX008]
MPKLLLFPDISSSNLDFFCDQMSLNPPDGLGVHEVGVGEAHVFYQIQTLCRLQKRCALNGHDSFNLDEWCARC